MWRNIKKLIKNFFIEEKFQHTIFGAPCNISRTIKTGNIAILISIITLVIILWKI